jgi:predicted alpha/beta-fold hydrolase
MFAIGFSMGGNWLGMALAKDSQNMAEKLVASACIVSPMKMSSASSNLR